MIGEWQPIETAPRDGTRILLFVCGRIICGAWRDDKYAKRPRPYWGHDLEAYTGTRNMKNNPPTYWMPLPAVPE